MAHIAEKMEEQEPAISHTSAMAITDALMIHAGPLLATPMGNGV